MTRRMTLAEVAAAASDAGRILIAGCAAEPVALLDEVEAAPDLWRGRILTGAFIPGVNDRDLTAVGRDTAIETIFVTAGLNGVGVRHLPMHYSDFWDRLSRPGVVDMVVMTVPPPARDGSIGFGLACDFAPAAITAGARLIGLVNPTMPDVPGGPRLPADRFEALAETNAALPVLAPSIPDGTSIAIAERVVALLPVGGTLQLGLGKLQAAILSVLAVSGRRDARYHAGMISDPIMEVLDAGGLLRGVTTGVAIGTAGFYDRLHREDRVTWRPVGETHGHATLRALPSLISVNSALQVDLTGQANAEYVGGRQSSGQGGMVDFVRGARASKGGRAVLALPSRARGGTASRIVARLPQGAPVSVSRADVDLVVTEYGVADLREADLETRAGRLIAIAAPEFRDALAAQRRETT